MMDKILKVIEHKLDEDGMKHLIVRSNTEYDALCLIPHYCRRFASVSQTVNEDGFLYTVSWPVLDVQAIGANKLLFVHFRYGTRVSDCVRLAVEGFRAGNGDLCPTLAYVRVLPKGAVNGIEVHGVMLFAADWMARNCVAVR